MEKSGLQASPLFASIATTTLISIPQKLSYRLLEFLLGTQIAAVSTTLLAAVLCTRVEPNVAPVRTYPSRKCTAKKKTCFHSLEACWRAEEAEEYPIMPTN